MPEAFTARAPGKLFIAGEYAVVEPGQPAVLVAVDRHLTVTATPTDGSPWRARGGPRDYLGAAAQAVEDLRRAHALPATGYTLCTSSHLARGGRKLGLGSSGAVTVAAVAALARLHGMGLSATQRFRLALCATIRISPRASGGDIAASTYGGWIHYTSPDRRRVAASLGSAGLAATIEDDDVWQGCTITPVPPPPLPLLVGWTGKPADTDTLVAAAGERPDYPGFTADSAAMVGEFLRAARSGDGPGLLAAVRRGRGILARFAAARAIPIETPALAALCEVAEAQGGAGKSSGAGGGDCGIAFAPHEARARILEQWGESGIIPLDLSVHPHEGDVL